MDHSVDSVTLVEVFVEVRRHHQLLMGKLWYSEYNGVVRQWLCPIGRSTPDTRVNSK